MPAIDNYSYHLGAADCFCEMVAAGVKKIALSHPCNSKESRDSFLPDFDRLCSKYGVRYYVEDEPFLTVLFPESMNRGKYNAIFYCEDRYIEEYLSLKKQKQLLMESGSYTQTSKQDIAWRYGRLLSYSDEGIRRLLARNPDIIAQQD